HLVVLYCRSLIQSSFVSQSPQLFPAMNPSAKCCCSHATSLFICASLDSCCSCLICWATSLAPWAWRLMESVRQQDRLRTAVAIVFVIVRVSSVRVTEILHVG